MKAYLILGDSHGDLEFVEKAAYLAAQNDATLIQTGDFGFLWPNANQVGALSLILQRAGEQQAKPPVKMLFVDGNHDWHTQLRRAVMEAQHAEKAIRGRTVDWCGVDGSNGGVPIAPFVTYQPRGSVFEDTDGTRFLFCGGAPSIDYEHRTEGRSWWEKEEVISEEEYAAALAVEGPIHVLITHDAPTYPPGYGPKGTPWFQARGKRSMEMIAGLIEKHQPPVHFHGHFHTSYFRRSGNNVTTTYGLASNANRFNDAVMLWSRDGGYGDVVG